MATVNTKVAEPTATRALPREIDGTVVDVRQASANKRERILDPAVYAAAGRTTPDVGAVRAGGADLTIRLVVT